MPRYARAVESLEELSNPELAGRIETAEPADLRRVAWELLRRLNVAELLARRFVAGHLELEELESPSLSQVLEAMPAGLDPAEIEGFLTTPNPNLVVDDRIVTVTEFLAAGADVEVVVNLAIDLDRW